MPRAPMLTVVTLTTVLLTTLSVVGTAHANGPGATTSRHVETMAATPTSLPSYIRGPRVAGIDVSAYQRHVAWSARRAAGDRFVWIKATEGLTWRSPQFTAQYRRATSARWLRGAYHFARPNSSSGTAQARAFVANGGRWMPDDRTLPGALDLEAPPSGRACYHLTPARMVMWIHGFTSEYKRLTGRSAVLYTSNRWWLTCTANSRAFAARNPLWLAHYAPEPGGVPGGWPRPIVWQNAIDGGLDRNVWFGTLAQLTRWARRSSPGIES